MTKVFKPRRTWKSVLANFIETHGNRYDYSEFKFTGMYKHGNIICRQHGVFKQTPTNHAKGQNCKKCSTIHNNRNSQIKYTREVVEAGLPKNISLLIFSGIDRRGKFKCYDCGCIWDTRVRHVYNSISGCPGCAGNKKLSINEMVTKFEDIHGDKYNYDEFVYVNMNTKAKIFCKTHKEYFWQTPSLHIESFGCPKCGVIQRGLNGRTTKHDFIEKCKLRHGDIYSYDRVVYKTIKDKIEIFCKKHKEYFWQSAEGHSLGYGCPKCSSVGPSKSEIELYDFIKSIYTGKIIQSDRTVLKGKELDIYLPELKIAFEYNGLYWHSEAIQHDRYYHVKKTELCESKDIHLIHIWEDQWLENPNIVKKMIQAKCRLKRKMIYARKCTVDYDVNTHFQRRFYNENHIQGYGQGSVVLALLNDSGYVAMMSFKKRTTGEFELTRFASKNVVGSFGKLLKHFQKLNPNKSIISFGARDVVFRHNNIYLQHGFKEHSILNEDYKYVVDDARIHKFNFRKDKILKRFPNAGLDIRMTERQMMLKLNIYRIYDSGLIKYVL